MEWYVKCWRQYADFSGRARRKEYWMFALFNAAIVAVLMFVLPTVLVLLGALLMQMSNEPDLIGNVVSYIFYTVVGLYGLAVLVPGLAVAVRRMHDIGKSGWTILLGLIPFVGGILLLVFYCQDSEPRENKWGASPKA